MRRERFARYPNNLRKTIRLPFGERLTISKNVAVNMKVLSFRIGFKGEPDSAGDVAVLGMQQSSCVIEIQMVRGARPHDVMPDAGAHTAEQDRFVAEVRNVDR